MLCVVQANYIHQSKDKTFLIISWTSLKIVCGELLNNVLRNAKFVVKWCPVITLVPSPGPYVFSIKGEKETKNEISDSIFFNQVHI